jgi:ATP-binding cassette subfamily A (ABC1) protein 3
MNLGAYWLGNFIYDFFLYAILAIFTAVVCQIMEIKAFTEGSALTALWLFLIAYGLAYLPFTYIFSYAFTDPGDA